MKRQWMNLAKYSSYGLITASFMAACGQDEGGVAEVKVTNGLEIDNSDYPSVVLLLLNGRSICTGTFINDSQLITAAHCVDGMRESSPDIRLVEPMESGGRTQYKTRARAGSFVKNRAYSTRENNGVNGSDLAIVNFPRYSAPGIRPIADYSPEIEQEITIVGFGNNKNYVDEMGKQTGEGSGKKRVGTNFVRMKEDGMIVFAGLPEALDDYKMGEWTASGSGDSGGPLFIKGRLAGITSGGGVIRNANGDSISISKYVDLNSQESQNFIEQNRVR